MKRLATDLAFAALAGLALAGCASNSASVSSAPAMTRSAAPMRYETTVNNYFDLTMPAQSTPRKLYVGAPERSHCALFGTGGRHGGWMVPVIYDTTPPQTPHGSASKTSDKSAKATTQPLKVSTSGTPPAASSATVSLKDVSITGTRYFFWFSSETLAGVTREPELCP